MINTSFPLMFSKTWIFTSPSANLLTVIFPKLHPKCFTISTCLNIHQILPFESPMFAFPEKIKNSSNPFVLSFVLSIFSLCLLKGRLNLIKTCLPAHKWVMKPISQPKLGLFFFLAKDHLLSLCVKTYPQCSKSPNNTLCFIYKLIPLPFSWKMC